MRIIYIDVDCLRPDHLGCYGYGRPTSPNIDRIADQGMRFTHYYTGSSPCLPSRTAWSSGRFGIRNGVMSNHDAGAQFYLRTRRYVGPEADNEMLMRQLRRYGYDTYCFSNFADRHNALWFMYGWTEYHTPNLKGGQETAQEINDILLPWLRENASRENYFLHVNYWDVHRVYKMDASWADRFDGMPVEQSWPDQAAIDAHQEIRGPFTATGQFRDNESPYPLMPGSIATRSDFEHMLTGYDASIAYTDHYIGQIFEELERQGLLEDAVIIITGDHGDAFGEHGIYSDHVCADECIHRVPLIVKWPGVAPTDSVSDALLYNVDFAPTLCELLDAEAAADWDGESFAENLRGNPGLDRDYLVWDHGLYTVQRAVRTKTHLMIQTYDDFGYQFDPVELYNMEADPYQSRNIRDEHPDIIQQCDHYLSEWMQEQRRKGHNIPDPLTQILRERSQAGT